MSGLLDLLPHVVALPAGDLEDLATAVAEGSDSVDRLRARSGSPLVRSVCDELLRLLSSHNGDFLSGWLTGAAASAEATRRSQQIDIVWTGPESEVDTGRLTSQVVIDLIGEAQSELLLASYATNPQQRTVTALSDALQRGVDITVLLERSVDNPAYRSDSEVLRELPVRRLIWPAEQRVTGASLHPKFIVVDKRLALIGSANLTGRALDVNMECGVLIRNGPHPRAIADHVWSLVHAGKLISLPGIQRGMRPS